MSRKFRNYEALFCWIMRRIESTTLIRLVHIQIGPPPAGTPENPRPRPTQVPGTFTLLIYGK
jgi:hypothetical protein